MLVGRGAASETSTKSTPIGKAEPQTLAEALMMGPMQHPVRLLFLDVDGTLTDGVIGHTPDWDYRNFWVRDPKAGALSSSPEPSISGQMK